MAIQKYFSNFDLFRSESFRTMLIGSSIYAGLKISSKSPTVSKGVILTSSIAALYFGRLLERDGFIRTLGGVGTKFGIVDIGVSINDIIDRTYQASIFVMDSFKSFRNTT